MQDYYFPLFEMPQYDTFGVGAYFRNILCTVKVNLVTPRFNGLVALNTLVQNIFYVCLFSQGVRTKQSKLQFFTNRFCSKHIV